MNNFEYDILSLFGEYSNINNFSLFEGNPLNWSFAYVALEDIIY